MSDDHTKFLGLLGQFDFIVALVL